MFFLFFIFLLTVFLIKINLKVLSLLFLFYIVYVYNFQKTQLNFFENSVINTNLIFLKRFFFKIFLKFQLILQKNNLFYLLR